MLRGAPEHGDGRVARVSDAAAGGKWEVFSVMQGARFHARSWSEGIVFALAAAAAMVFGSTRPLLHAAETPPEPGRAQPRPSRIRADRPKAAPPTAPPPKWDKETLEVFAADARQQLGPGGPRQPGVVAAAIDSEAQVAPAAAGGTADGKRWASLISGETLEDEIKALSIEVAADLRSPGAFKSGGFQGAAARLTQLAALFEIIAEYDGPVRWKSQADAYAELLRRAGRNCKAASDAAYKEARQRADELAELVRGGNVESVGETLADREGEGWLDRRPLMSRLEASQQQRLGPWTANEAEFARQQPQLRHEAELLAAVAELIPREGYEFADDDGFREQASQLQTAARQLRAAVEQSDYERARAALSEVNQSCDRCHADYRG